MSLTLRTVKGSALTHAELDNNFLWLEGRDIKEFDLLGSNLVLTKYNGDTLSVSLTGFSGGTISGDTFVTGGTLNGTILELERNDGGIVQVDLSGLPGVSGNTYTNTTPTPTTIGGIEAGSTFTAQTMQQMWDALLYPYQYPAFTSFARTNLSSVYELGENILIGSQTFSWSNSNDSNIQTNSIYIEQLSPATVTLVSALNPDGSTGFTLTTTTNRTTTGSLSLYRITGTNTQAGTFNSTISANWRPRWYYGRSTNTSITGAEMTGFTGNALVSSVVDDYVTFSSGSGYLYLCVPDTLTQPTDLRDSVAGCFGTNIPYSTLSDITITNPYGVSITYKIYRTINQILGSQDVWLCS
jgi:hypothetical protein